MTYCDPPASETDDKKCNCCSSGGSSDGTNPSCPQDNYYIYASYASGGKIWVEGCVSSTSGKDLSVDYVSCPNSSCSDDAKTCPRKTYNFHYSGGTVQYSPGGYVCQTY